jgi:hypothetical protein
VSAMSASRLDTLQVSSIAILDTERGNPLEPKGMAIRFPFDQYHHPLLLRFEEAVKSVEERFGSRFPPEAVTIKSDPKTTASSSAPTPKYGIGMIGDVAATICRRLCCRTGYNARRFV